MKYTIENKKLFLLLTFIWCIINESFSYIQLIYGSIFSILTIFICFKLLNGEHFINHYKTSIFLFLKFLFITFINIYKSTFITTKLILTGKVQPKFYKISTKVKGDLWRCLIANAITLTPGTVTVDMDENTLLVLAIGVKAKDEEEAGYQIKGHFESVILEEVEL